MSESEQAPTAADKAHNTLVDAIRAIRRKRFTEAYNHAEAALGLLCEAEEEASNG